MKLNWKTLFLLTTCCTLGLMTSVRAQITPDNSLGAESSTLGQPNQAINGIPINQIDQINGGARRGGNLFHSFGEFNVNAGRGAYFTNPDGVANILTRVTGVNRSNILGTLGVLGNANLFLINPNGIFFGPNASLDLGGSFFGSSANSLLFDNGFEFSATNPQAPPLLTVNIPIGLRFRDSPGNITNQSVVQDNTGFSIGLRVNPGNSLALVGGNVSLEQGGRLTAAGGRIELGGLAGAGTVGLQTTGNTFRLNFPANGLSNVSLLDDARVAVRSNGGGDIAVNANIFTATNGGRLVGGIEGIATRNGGDITVNSNEFNISGVGLQSGFAAGIAQQVVDGASGNAGNIFVNTKSFNASSGGQLRNTVESTGTGNAGNISVTSNNSLSLTNAEIDVSVLSGASGNAGNITINAGSIFTNNALLRARNEGNGSAGNISLQVGDAIALTNGSQISSSIFGRGNAGDVTLRAENGDISLAGGSDIFSTVQSGGTGNAGKIDIITRNLSLTDGSQLQSSLLAGQQGNAGNITVQATGTVRIAGRNSNGFSGIFSNVGSEASGNAGNIFINAGSISTDDALLTTSNARTGYAGNISLQAGDAIDLTNNTEISSSIFGTGNAGNVTLRAENGDISLARDSNIFNRVGSGGRGNAGDVTLRAENGDISFAGGSDIFSTVESGGTGNAGKIDIITRNLSLTDGSQLQTLVRAGEQSNAGNITVQASGTVRIAGSDSDGIRSGIFSNVFSGASGNAGNISINAGSISTDNALLRARNQGNGSAGNISLQAGDAIALTNGTEISSSIFGTGNAGNVTLRAENGDISLARDSDIFNTVGSGGKGNAGDVTLRAENGDISFAGGSDIFSTVESGGTGNAGKIDIITRNLSLTNSSQLLTSVRAGQQGNAGNITVQASGTVRIAGRQPGGNPSAIFSNVLSGISGNGGNITINAGSIFTDDAVLVTSNAGRGNAGNISLKVGDAIALTNGSVIISSIFGRGNAGDVTLRAENGDISFAGGSDIFSTVESGGMGNAGKIDIITRNLSLTDGSLINSSTFGRGNAGNISLQVGDAIALANSSYIASIVGRGGEGIGGDIDIRGRSLTLTGGSLIATALSGEGKGRAGNIEINATDFVNIFGVGTTGLSSGLFASAERGTTAISPQAAGNINLTTGDFRIGDGAVVDALTYNSGDAGNITINANTFTANGGGQVITTTYNSGSAGNINLNVRDRITISGSDPNYNQRIQGTFDNQGAASGIFANTARDSTGNGGNITIQPLQNSFPTIAISDGGEVTVDSQGQGQGGEISITGNSLSLDRGIINASTQSANGGNINLRLRNFIRLRNESLISADARGQQGGNGGNITINTPFIIAFPRNNDITANAGKGSGGQVIINATLFGINPLSAEDLRRLRPNDSNPRQLPTSDITAISRDNPSLSLPVQVNSPDVDPSRGLVELPEAVTDPTQKVAQNPCRQGIGNEFFVTGRGGLPTTPNQTLNSDNVRVDLLQPVASSGNSPSATKKPATTVTAKRVPAQGWIFNDKGQVVLTAYNPTNTDSQRPFSTAAACPAR